MKKWHGFFGGRDGEAVDPFAIELSPASLDTGKHFVAPDLDAAIGAAGMIFVGPLPEDGLIAPIAPVAAMAPMKLAPPQRGEVLAAAGPVTSLTQAQVDALEAGLDATLASIQANVVAQVFADTLPLLGDNLLAAATGGAAQLNFVTALKDAIVSGLGTLSGSETYTEAQVEGAINSALTAAGITGTGANLNLADGADIKLTFTTGKNFAALTTALEGDLGLPGLGVSTSGNAQTIFNHTLNFTSGLDAGGFYLGTGAGQTTFTIATTTTLPGFAADATLSLLKFSATDNAATPTNFNATFTVALKDPNNDGHVRPGELGGDLLDATLTGNAAINLKLASDLGTAVLPNIAADLGFNWGFSNAVVDSAAGYASFGNVPTVTFKNVSLGLGSFFDDFVGPVLGSVQDVTSVLQPIVDVLTAEVGFLSDLAGEPVTVLDIAGGIGAVDAETAARLELYADLINFINSIPTDGGGARIDLGDFSLGAQDPRAALFQLANAVPQSIRNALAPGAQNAGLDGFLDGKDALPGGGLAFPIIENPITAINLLFGKPVDFFTYSVPGLDIDPIGFDEFYRIFGPFGVRFTATVEAHALLDIGYDSTGLAQFALSGDAEDIFNGFFVVDQVGPEATLTAQLQAFAAVNVILAELGFGGGLTGNLFVELNDNDSTPGDGRVHIAEVNGCLFELSGEVTAGLTAYLEIDFGLFSETYEEDYGHDVLLNFNGTGCDVAGMPGVPVLAHVLGSTVVLHVGNDSALRQVGVLIDNADHFSVTHAGGTFGDEDLAVISSGLLTEAGEPVPPQGGYHAGSNARITADGGEFNDNLALAPDVLTPADFNGEAGDDRLVGGAGADTLNGGAGFDLLVGGAGNDTLNGGGDRDFLDGQDDDDTLLGGSEADILLGGPGADVLNGGPGYDTASYASATVGIVLNLSLGIGSNDAAGDTYISIERIVGSPHADIMNGSAGSDNFSGGAGGDVLDGKEGDDLLVGDAGADDLTGGPGNDFAAYSLSLAGVNVSLATGLGIGGDAEGDTLHTIENLQGTADFADTLEGDGNQNWLRGLNGNNVLRGLGGADLLEGGKDNDTLEGGDGADTLRASADVASLDPLVSGGSDMLFGGAGNDFLFGDAGGDTLDGGGDDDQILGGKDNDTIFGGAGADTISGGAGADTINTGDGTNSVSGDDGNDVITGGSEADTLNGNAGNDQINAGDGDDSVEGGSGADGLDGGPGRDALRYVSSPAAVIVDLLVNAPTGPAGSDAVGDFIANFEDLYGSAFADDLRGTAGDNRIEGGDGADWIQGRAGNDHVAGGNGNDLLEVGTLRGPVQDSQRTDRIFGGAGFDTITADFSNQTIPITVIAGQTWTYVFADGASASDFENVHDFFTGSGDDVLRLDGAADDGFANLLRTGAGADTIFSGLGDDNVDAGDGANVLDGGPGNDVLTSGADADTIDGGTGNDTISAGGGDNLITGGDGADAITSGPGLDTITSGAGNDTISAGDGDNVVNSGTDNDNITTGSGHDTVSAEDGNDIIVAGAGRELIDAGAGNDLITVGALRGPVQDTERLDRIEAGAGFDIVSADFSNQTIAISIIAGQTQSLDFADGAYVRSFENVHDFFTGSGNDSLRLDGAADDAFANLLRTGMGGDIIYSGAGSDNVDAGDGDDFVNGGANDTVILTGGFGTVIGFSGPGETLAGGAGTDTLSFEGYVKPTGFPPGLGYHTHFGVLINLGTNATDGAARGITISGFENIIGTEYGDSLTGDDGPNVFNPLHGSGSVNIAATGGPDYIDGKGGIDTLFIDFSREDLPTSTGITSGAGSFSRQTPASPFSTSDQTNSTGIEIFHIIGASKNDQLAAQAVGFNDILIGLGGNDTLGGRSGSDTLRGGDGNDILTGQGGGGLAYDGTAGGHDVFEGGDGDDRIEDLAISGTVFTALGADALFQLDGGAGFDSFSADFSNQSAAILWDNTAPTDMTFADGAFYRGFELMRTFASGSGNDSITQLGRFDNIFSTGGGNDTVAPGLGLDEVNGGAGDDLLVLDFSIGDQPAYNGIYGLVYFGGGYTGALSRDHPGFGIIDRVGIAGFERLHVTGTSHADTIGDLTGDDIILGLGGNDTIVGVMGGAGYFDGGDGNDTITGFSGGGGGVVGDETLIGGEGNDTINGEAGNDTMLGGAGDDVLNGAGFSGVLRGGLDFIDGGDGNDFINESYGVSDNFTYMPAGTRLQLDGGAGFDTLSADFGNQTQAVIFSAANPQPTEFSDGAYIRNFEAIRDLTTGAGADVLAQPGRFANKFSTRDGNDIVNPGLGIDIVYGGLGDDLLILDYSLGDDANLGGLTFVFNGSPGARRDTTTNAVVDSITNGSFERFQITGGSKADILTGGPGVDIFIGNAGNDTLNGDRGNDVIDAGPGDDRVSVESTVDAAQLDQLDGGTGFDVLVAARFLNETAPVIFDSRAPTSTDFASGAYFRNFEQIEWLQTGSGADSLTQLGRVNNHFETNGGDDVMAVGLGIDDIFGGLGTDTLIVDYTETAGENVRLETSGPFFYRRDVATNAIVDRVSWQSVERFQITGTRNNDTITTGALDDILNVGRGNDTATGAGGTDLLILDWSAMTSGAQGANYTAFNAATGSGTLTTSNAAGFTVAFSGIERFDLTGTGLGDELRGAALADVLRGGAGNDTLIGGPGVDVLDGGEGDDTLQGGGGTGQNGQWASSVISFTSQYSATDWSAAQMLGAPNTFSYGSINTAWAASASNGGIEQLVLGYAAPVQATGVMIREIWGNGFVTRVDLLDINDQFHTVFTGPDPSLPGTPVDFAINFPLTSYVVKGVKIFVDKNHNLGTYEEIDAVQLQGPQDAADQLIGGAGNDIYLVEAGGNVIVEAPGEGSDEVRSQVDFILPANVENLVLLGNATAGTGNTLANVLTGNALANMLDGGPGADAMSGGAGDDIYVVDAIADIIAEQAGEGNDTVRAMIDFTLGANLENLILEGRALSGTGNTLANIITGNDRNNDLHGGDGADVLTGGKGLGLAGSHEVDALEGGAGADTFVLGDADFRYYDDRSSLTPGVDAYVRILDFAPPQGDKLKLKGTAVEYFLGASPVAGVAGTGLFHDTNFDGLLDAAHDELLAILESPDALTHANTIDAAIFI